MTRTSLLSHLKVRVMYKWKQRKVPQNRLYTVCETAVKRAELVLSTGNGSLRYTDELFVASMYMKKVIKHCLLSRISGCEPNVTYLGHIFEYGLNKSAVCRAISTHNCNGRWHLSLARPIIAGIEFTAKLHWTLHLTPFNGKKICQLHSETRRLLLHLPQPWACKTIMRSAALPLTSQVSKQLSKDLEVACFLTPPELRTGRPSEWQN